MLSCDQTLFKPAKHNYCFVNQNQFFEITPATNSDLPALAKIARKTIEETYKHGYYTAAVLDKRFDEKFIEETLPGELLNPNILYLICKLKIPNSLIGYAKVELTDDMAILDKLYLLKEYHGRKLGFMLMQACVSYAKQQGKDSMSLIVYEKNPTVSFYQKLGFTSAGERFQFKDPATGADTDEYNIKMICDLNKLNLQLTNTQSSNKVYKFA